MDQPAESATSPISSIGSSSPSQSQSQPQQVKVIVLFVPIANAPQLKQAKFKISADSSFSALQLFLRKQLQLKPEESLFMYCSSAFRPTPDQLVGDLFSCFGTSNMLTVHYCLTPAYG
eukprot:ANDGO_07907.mRNA.1 Ubiquitin-like protein ATG12